MLNKTLIMEQTSSWIKNVIVKHNICPFAGREVIRNSIRYSVFESRDLADCLALIVDECRILDRDARLETTFLIYPVTFSYFEEFLDFVDVANALLIDSDYEGVYQLATFHPEYCFAEEPYDDPANFTNRSPYAMLHIIREASLERVLENFPNPERIPQNNIELTRKLGHSQMQALLQSCYDIKIES